MNNEKKEAGTPVKPQPSRKVPKPKDIEAVDIILGTGLFVFGAILLGTTIFAGSDNKLTKGVSDTVKKVVNVPFINT